MIYQHEVIGLTQIAMSWQRMMVESTGFEREKRDEAIGKKCTEECSVWFRFVFICLNNSDY